MAIYRLSADVMKRSAGRSATAAAAYRAGADIADERTGQRFDYTRRRGVLHSEIMAPADAPAWMRDRAQLWNAVEKAEKRKDAQLARDIELALPHELSHAQRVELVRVFVGAEFVARGMVADVAIHAPSGRGDQRNAHAHIMLTMRALTGEGFGNKERGWNDTERLEGGRASWADHVNATLEQAGHAARVDHRSLEAQGIDRVPQIHKGPVISEMEARGVETARGQRAAAIDDRNAEIAALRKQQEQLAAQRAALEHANDNPTNDGTNREDRVMSAEHSTEDEAARAVARDDQPASNEQTKAAAENETKTEDHTPTLEQDAAEQAKREAALLEQMERQAKARSAFVEAQTAEAEQARRDEAARREADAARERNGDVADPKSRYAQALADEYRVEAPYASLARAAMAEYGRFMKQQEDLTRQIVAAKTPEDRRSLELRKEIEGCDYMSTTSRRLAGMSRVVTGDSHSEQASRDEEKARFYEERAAALRAERARLGQERGEGTTGRDGKGETTNKAQERSGGEARDGAPPRAGVPPTTAKEHEAISRAQEAERRQRAPQADQQRQPQSRYDSSLAAAEAGRERRAETPAERARRYQQLADQTNAKATGRNGPGRDGGGRGGGGSSR